MFNTAVKFALSALTLGFVVGTGAERAEATTLYTFGGSFGGSVNPQQQGNQQDFFSSLVNGSIDYNESSHQLTLSFSFNGTVRDTAAANSATIANLSGQITYVYGNVLDVNLTPPAGGNDSQYLIAAMPEGLGNGVGTGNFTLTSNGLVDNNVFDVTAKAASFNGNEDYFSAYNPVATYLQGRPAGQRGAYFILGDLGNGTSFVNNAVKAWLMSGLFDLGLGAGRTGQYFIVGDIHGQWTSRTEVPEPASLALLGVGLLGAAARKRRLQ